MCYPHEWQQLSRDIPIASRNHRFYVAHPAINRYARTPRDHRRRNPVHLLPCHRPTGTLERAPRTSLQPCAHEVPDGEQWDGFWSLDDEKYYARCIERGGREIWYRIADARGTPVLPLRRRWCDETRSIMMIGRVGRRSMLVGRYSGRVGAKR